MFARMKIAVERTGTRSGSRSAIGAKLYFQKSPGHLNACARDTQMEQHPVGNAASETCRSRLQRGGDAFPPLSIMVGL